MSAFSSIPGFMPLPITAGVGATNRQVVGPVVVGGMIAATIFSLLFVPYFFLFLAGLAQGARKKQEVIGQ